MIESLPANHKNLLGNYYQMVYIVRKTVFLGDSGLKISYSLCFDVVRDLCLSKPVNPDPRLHKHPA